MPTESYTRNASEVITSVKRTFGDESGVEVTDEDIIRWINDAQLEIIVQNPEVNASFAQVNITAGVSSYPMLANISNMYGIQAIHYNGEYLNNLTFQQAQAHIIRKDTGQGGIPELWYERAGVVHLYPKPAADIPQGLGVFYSAKPAKITSNSTPLSVPDHYFQTVCDYCLQQAYMLDENLQLSQAAKESFGQGIAQRANRVESQSNSYPTISVVD
jgi:hypothetical protein